MEDDNNIAKSLEANERTRLEAEINQLVLIEKAFRSGDPSSIIAANERLSKLAHNGDSKSIVFDPYMFHNSFGYKQTVSSISYDYLRKMAHVPVPRAVIDTRLSQLVNFSRPTVEPEDVGWTIRKRKGLFDEKIEMTPEEKKKAEKLIRFVESCGTEDGYGKFYRDSFPVFLRKTAKDSLELDQMAFEIVPNRAGAPDHFEAFDGATYRLADHLDYETKNVPEINGFWPKYIQVYKNKPVAEFHGWELCLGMRNVNTDMSRNGYPVSELEDLVRIITWMLYGDSYNGKFFSQGAAPKGILKVAGNVNQDKLNEFRTYWQNMVAGVANAWRTPVLESDKIEWIDLQKSNQDMQFGSWQEYLLRIMCAIYKIDPVEVGFAMAGMTGGQGGQYTSVKQHVDYSKDKGLLPLLRHYEDWITMYIVAPLDPTYEFRWTGITPDDEASAVDLDVKKVGAFMTVNEIRKKRGLPELKTPDGDKILNGTSYQYNQAAMMGDPGSNQFVEDQFGDDGGGEEAADQGGQQFVDDADFSEDYVMKAKTALSGFEEVNKWIREGMPDTKIIK